MTPETNTTTEDSSERPTTRDVAEIGVRLRDDGRLFKTALRAMASADPDVGSDEWEEFVAAQVYGEAQRGTDPADALAFVDAIVARHEIEDLGDVNDLLGRESHEQKNYEGSLGMVRAQ